MLPKIVKEDRAGASKKKKTGACSTKKGEQASGASTARLPAARAASHEAAAADGPALVSMVDPRLVALPPIAKPKTPVATGRLSQGHTLHLSPSPARGQSDWAGLPAPTSPMLRSPSPTGGGGGMVSPMLPRGDHHHHAVAVSPPPSGSPLFLTSPSPTRARAGVTDQIRALADLRPDDRIELEPVRYYMRQPRLHVAPNGCVLTQPRAGAATELFTIAVDAETGIATITPVSAPEDVVATVQSTAVCVERSDRRSRNGKWRLQQSLTDPGAFEVIAFAAGPVVRGLRGDGRVIAFSDPTPSRPAPPRPAFRILRHTATEQTAARRAASAAAILPPAVMSGPFELIPTGFPDLRVTCAAAAAAASAATATATSSDGCTVSLEQREEELADRLRTQRFVVDITSSGAALFRTDNSAAAVLRDSFGEEEWEVVAVGEETFRLEPTDPLRAGESFELALPWSGSSPAAAGKQTGDGSTSPTSNICRVFYAATPADADKYHDGVVYREKCVATAQGLTELGHVRLLAGEPVIAPPSADGEKAADDHASPEQQTETGAVADEPLQAPQSSAAASGNSTMPSFLAVTADAPIAFDDEAVAWPLCPALDGAGRTFEFSILRDAADDARVVLSAAVEVHREHPSGDDAEAVVEHRDVIIVPPAQPGQHAVAVLPEDAALWLKQQQQHQHHDTTSDDGDDNASSRTSWAIEPIDEDTTRAVFSSVITAPDGTPVVIVLTATGECLPLSAITEQHGGGTPASRQAASVSIMSVADFDAQVAGRGLSAAPSRPTTVSPFVDPSMRGLVVIEDLETLKIAMENDVQKDDADKEDLPPLSAPIELCDPTLASLGAAVLARADPSTLPTDTDDVLKADPARALALRERTADLLPAERQYRLRKSLRWTNSEPVFNIVTLDGQRWLGLTLSSSERTPTALSSTVVAMPKADIGDTELDRFDWAILRNTVAAAGDDCATVCYFCPRLRTKYALAAHGVIEKLNVATHSGVTVAPKEVLEVSADDAVLRELKRRRMQLRVDGGAALMKDVDSVTSAWPQTVQLAIAAIPDPPPPPPPPAEEEAPAAAKDDDEDAAAEQDDATAEGDGNEARPAADGKSDADGDEKKNDEAAPTTPPPPPPADDSDETKQRETSSNADDKNSAPPGTPPPPPEEEEETKPTSAAASTRSLLCALQAGIDGERVVTVEIPGQPVDDEGHATTSCEWEVMAVERRDENDDDDNGWLRFAAIAGGHRLGWLGYLTNGALKVFDEGKCRNDWAAQWAVLAHPSGEPGCYRLLPRSRYHSTYSDKSALALLNNGTAFMEATDRDASAWRVFAPATKVEKAPHGTKLAPQPPSRSAAGSPVGSPGGARQHRAKNAQVRALRSAADAVFPAYDGKTVYEVIPGAVDAPVRFAVAQADTSGAALQKVPARSRDDRDGFRCIHFGDGTVALLLGKAPSRYDKPRQQLALECARARAGRPVAGLEAPLCVVASELTEDMKTDHDTIPASFRWTVQFAPSGEERGDDVHQLRRFVLHPANDSRLTVAFDGRIEMTETPRTLVAVEREHADRIAIITARKRAAQRVLPPPAAVFELSVGAAVDAPRIIAPRHSDGTFLNSAVSAGERPGDAARVSWRAAIDLEGRVLLRLASVEDGGARALMVVTLDSKNDTSGQPALLAAALPDSTKGASAAWEVVPSDKSRGHFALVTRDPTAGASSASASNDLDSNAAPRVALEPDGTLAEYHSSNKNRHAVFTARRATAVAQEKAREETNRLLAAEADDREHITRDEETAFSSIEQAEAAGRAEHADAAERAKAHADAQAAVETEEAAARDNIVEDEMRERGVVDDDAAADRRDVLAAAEREAGADRAKLIDEEAEARAAIITEEAKEWTQDHVDVEAAERAAIADREEADKRSSAADEERRAAEKDETAGRSTVEADEKEAWEAIEAQATESRAAAESKAAERDAAAADEAKAAQRIADLEADETSTRDTAATEEDSERAALASAMADEATALANAAEARVATIRRALGNGEDLKNYAAISQLASDGKLKDEYTGWEFLPGVGAPWLDTPVESLRLTVQHTRPNKKVIMKHKGGALATTTSGSFVKDSKDGNESGSENSSSRTQSFAGGQSFTNAGGDDTTEGGVKIPTLPVQIRGRVGRCLTQAFTVSLSADGYAIFHLSSDLSIVLTVGAESGRVFFSRYLPNDPNQHFSVARVDGDSPDVKVSWTETLSASLAPFFVIVARVTQKILEIQLDVIDDVNARRDHKSVQLVSVEDSSDFAAWRFVTKADADAAAQREEERQRELTKKREEAILDTVGDLGECPVGEMQEAAESTLIWQLDEKSSQIVVRPRSTDIARDMQQVAMTDAGNGYVAIVPWSNTEQALGLTEVEDAEPLDDSTGFTKSTKLNKFYAVGVVETDSKDDGQSFEIVVVTPASDSEPAVFALRPLLMPSMYLRGSEDPDAGGAITFTSELVSAAQFRFVPSTQSIIATSVSVASPKSEHFDNQARLQAAEDILGGDLSQQGVFEITAIAGREKTELSPPEDADCAEVCLMVPALDDEVETMLPLVLADHNPQSINQRFVFMPAGDGYVAITPWIDAASALTLAEDGSELTCEDFAAATNADAEVPMSQQFELVPGPLDATFTIRPRLYDTGALAAPAVCPPELLEGKSSHDESETVALRAAVVRNVDAADFSAMCYFRVRSTMEGSIAGDLPRPTRTKSKKRIKRDPTPRRIEAIRTLFGDAFADNDGGESSAATPSVELQPVAAPNLRVCDGAPAVITPRATFAPDQTFVIRHVGKGIVTLSPSSEAGVCLGVDGEKQVGFFAAEPDADEQRFEMYTIPVDDSSLEKLDDAKGWLSASPAAFVLACIAYPKTVIEAGLDEAEGPWKFRVVSKTEQTNFCDFAARPHDAFLAEDRNAEEARKRKKAAKRRRAAIEKVVGGDLSAEATLELVPTALDVLRVEAKPQSGENESVMPLHISRRARDAKQQIVVVEASEGYVQILLAPDRTHAITARDGDLVDAVPIEARDEAEDSVLGTHAPSQCWSVTVFEDGGFALTPVSRPGTFIEACLDKPDGEQNLRLVSEDEASNFSAFMFAPYEPPTGETPVEAPKKTKAELAKEVEIEARRSDIAKAFGGDVWAGKRVTLASGTNRELQVSPAGDVESGATVHVQDTGKGAVFTLSDAGEGYIAFEHAAHQGMYWSVAKSAEDDTVTESKLQDFDEASKARFEVVLLEGVEGFCLTPASTPGHVVEVDLEKPKPHPIRVISENDISTFCQFVRIDDE